MITTLQTLEYLENQMRRDNISTLLYLVENPYYKNWNIFGYQTGNENDPYGTEQLLLTIISNYYSQVNVQGDYLKVLKQIKTIVDTSYYKYQKLYDSINFEYDPIVNYDRTDTETTLLNRSNVDTTTDDDRQYETDERIKRTTKHKNKISTYKSTYDSESPILTDETRYTNDNSDYTIEETTEPSSGNYTQKSFKNSGDVSTTVDYQTKRFQSQGYNFFRTDYFGNHGDTDTDAVELSSHILRAKGNIGVTTTQQMIMSERDVAMFNLIMMFVKEIIDYIAIPVYMQDIVGITLQELENGE
ncbi:MAG: hypothetical protein U0L42_00085 [Methanobrevibacter sp.]|uniref:hypothetical protein n=1 Tax=Methanobrevibacter sp. TaxID=66852 RepID=UPI002E7A23F8|nr:hypothetical protein [Methanobrevibacter sp.]MEE0934046.1 hypothetical protein [Methanobrevibacter sp.]